MAMHTYTKLHYIRSIVYPVVQRFSSHLKRHITSFGFVNINNDEQLFYEQSGEETNETILCIPGALGTTRNDFKYQLDNLSNEFNVIAFDPRGYGMSQGTPRKFDLNYYHQDAKDAAEVMKTLGHDKYSVLGWSDGGMVGIILAAKEITHVKSLVIWGSNAYVSDVDRQLLEKTRDLTNWSDKMRTPLESVYGQEGLRTLWGDLIDGYFAFSDQPNGICISELRDINCPTLVIHGEKDPLVQSFHPQFIHENIKNSKLKTFPDGKHNLHMRYHEEFNSLVHDFIKDPEKDI